MTESFTSHASNTKADSPADKRILTALHSMILDGTIAPGDKLTEVAIAEQFDVSRTPARLALRALEVEGIIKKRDGRGFTVQSLDLGEIRSAYEVRGVLEGLGAGTMAKSGMSETVDAQIKEAMATMDKALSSEASIAQIVQQYQVGNIAFHKLIMKNCGNPYVKYAFDRLQSLPMVKLGTVVFNKGMAKEDLMRLQLGNMQHRLIYDAMSKRDPQRAESMMREHANQTLVYSALFAPNAQD